MSWPLQVVQFEQIPHFGGLTEFLCVRFSRVPAILSSKLAVLIVVMQCVYLELLLATRAECATAWSSQVKMRTGENMCLYLADF